MEAADAAHSPLKKEVTLVAPGVQPSTKAWGAQEERERKLVKTPRRQLVHLDSLLLHISWLMRDRQPRLARKRPEAGRMSGRRLLRSAVSRPKRSREPKKCQDPRSHL